MGTSKYKLDDVEKRMAALIGEGKTNPEIRACLAKEGRTISLPVISTFRKKVLSGVVECAELDNIKPASVVVADEYLKSDKLMAKSFREIAERMAAIEDDMDWLEFMKEKRLHIELLMKKVGELDTVKQAVQVNVQNVITPEQFVGKANDYLFSLVKEGKVKLVSPELEQAYVKWLK